MIWFPYKLGHGISDLLGKWSWLVVFRVKLYAAGETLLVHTEHVGGIGSLDKRGELLFGELGVH